MIFHKTSLVTVPAQDRLHAHEGYEVRYILSGRGRFLRGSGRPIPVAPGDVVWNPPHCLHLMSGIPVCTFISFWLDEAFLERDPWLKGKMSAPGSMAASGDASLFFQKLRLDGQSGVPGLAPAAGYRLLSFLCELFAGKESVGSSGDLQVRECLRILSSEPFRDHPLGPLAEHVGLSVSQLIRRFRKEVGVAPGQFLTGLRLEEASRRLTQTRQTLDEIAEATGTGDGYAFSKLFKRHYGVSPGKWRARNARQE